MRHNACLHSWIRKSFVHGHSRHLCFIRKGHKGGHRCLFCRDEAKPKKSKTRKCR